MVYKKTILLTAATTALAAALSGCGSSSGSNGGDADTLSLGLVHSLTGTSAPFGASSKKGIDLAVSEINAAGGVNGKKIKVKEADDHTDPKEAINIVNKMINQDKVDAILGPTSSTATAVVGPIADKAKVPMMNAAGAAPGIAEIGPYVWRDTLGDAVLVPHVVETLKKKLDIKTAVLLYGNDDAFTKSVAQEFKSGAKKAGVKLLGTQTFASSDQDFSSQLTAAKELKPDALFVSAVPEGGAGILTAASKLGLDVPIIGGSGFNSPDMIKQAGKAAEGVYSGAAWTAAAGNAKSKAFEKAYKDKYDSAPDQFATQGYAGVYLFAEAAKDGKATREGVQKGLKGLKDVDSVLGTFNFTDEGDGLYDAVIVQVRDGRYTTVKQ